MKVRIATFNLENLDDGPTLVPTLADREKVLRPILERMDADIICFQEVNSQPISGGQRDLTALKDLIRCTKYSGFYIISTKTNTGAYYEQRNLVIISRYDIKSSLQYLNNIIEPIQYKKLTEITDHPSPPKVEWERPLLYVNIEINGIKIHLINVHLKSRIPTDIVGQKKNQYTWITNSGWAEGFFISSMKRVGQALEARMLIDRILDEDINSNIIICGDFNSHPEEVPVLTICGNVEDNGNKDLIDRVMIPCERTVPDSSRYSYLHQGSKRLLDHMLISRNLLNNYRKAEIFNETLHDETIAFATNVKYPESDHAPFIVEFDI